MTVWPASLATAEPGAAGRVDSGDFRLIGPAHARCLSGQKRALPSGGLRTLASRAEAFFTAGHDGPELLAGAIPYDRATGDSLFQPAEILSPPLSVPLPRGSLAGLPARIAARLRQEPEPALWRERVREALAQIEAGAFSKIVLSRSLHLEADTPFDEAGLFARMREDPLATAFSVPLPPAPSGATRRLIGATPELLLERRGRMVVSHPLAGSARRSASGAADRAAGEGLLASDKNRREHAMAAEMVLDTLAPWCDRLSAPEGVTLSATARMWHLGTRIEGRLRDPGTDCATLLAALHPTPAVCGLPREAAEAALPALEDYDRGFYAGAVGWLEPSGDGCWYLALRCAGIEGNAARLYAGAGIVAGSDPVAEEEETLAKFMAMLGVFGQEEASVSALVRMPENYA